MKKSFISLAVILLASGCATVTNGTKQTIALDLPKDEVCLLTSKSGTKISVQRPQVEVEVERDSSILTLHCGSKTENYVPSVNKAGMTSIVLIDFGLVDYATGALWEYKKQEQTGVEAK